MSRVRAIAITVLTTLVVLGAILVIAGTGKHPEASDGERATVDVDHDVDERRPDPGPLGRPEISTAIATFAASYARFLTAPGKRCWPARR